MIKNFKEAHTETTISYEVSFLGEDKGYGFPCDEKGTIKKEEMSEDAIKNYEYCIKHPKEFSIFNEIEKYENSYREPASGICKCGEKIHLFDEYFGACECPNCGQWYNMFGQELLPPSEWEE